MLFLTVFKSLKNKNKQMFVNLDRKLKNQQNVNINIEYKTFYVIWVFQVTFFPQSIGLRSSWCSFINNFNISLKIKNHF